RPCTRRGRHDAIARYPCYSLSYSSHFMMAIHYVPLRPPNPPCLPPPRGLALPGGLTPDDLEARRYRHALPRRLPYQLPVTRILCHRLLDPAPQMQDDLASGLVSVAGPRPQRSMLPVD